MLQGFDQPRDLLPTKWIEEMLLVVGSKLYGASALSACFDSFCCKVHGKNFDRCREAGLAGNVGPGLANGQANLGVLSRSYSMTCNPYLDRVRAVGVLFYMLAHSRLVREVKEPALILERLLMTGYQLQNTRSFIWLSSRPLLLLGYCCGFGLEQSKKQGELARAPFAASSSFSIFDQYS